MALTIAIANQKGGSAKTTSTVNLGAALAEKGKRVLLVDFDPQDNLSVYLGVDIEQPRKTVYQLLVEPHVTFRDIILDSPMPKLHLAPANIDLCAAEVQLVNEMSRERFLQRKLAAVQDEYDYILIDCPPSLGLLVVNALTAADQVIIPVQCSFLALRGLGQMLETVDKVRDRINPSLRTGGILLTMFNAQTTHAQEVVQLTRSRFEALVFQTMITRTVRFDESPVSGKPILMYAPQSRGAEEYRMLAQEVLRNGQSTTRRQPAREKTTRA